MIDWQRAFSGGKFDNNIYIYLSKGIAHSYGIYTGSVTWPSVYSIANTIMVVCIHTYTHWQTRISLRFHSLLQNSAARIECAKTIIVLCSTNIKTFPRVRWQYLHTSYLPSRTHTHIIRMCLNLCPCIGNITLQFTEWVSSEPFARKLSKSK